MKTQKQALDYALSMIGKGYDFDGTYGWQCFDTANYYWYYLFGHGLKGDGAIDIPTKNNFKGEATVYKNTPNFLAKAGDVVVFNANYGEGYGHVAIVVSANLNTITVVEQNWNGGGRYMTEVTTKRTHAYDFPMWFIRPKFKKSTVKEKVKKAIKHKIDDNIFDPISLGKWDIENETIEKMFVLNHKKYAYLKPNGKIKVASAGIPLKAFNTNQSFNDFIKNDFHHGKTVYNNKSIYNEQGVISIYPSETNIEKGEDYPTFYTDMLEDEKNSILEEIRNSYDYTQYDDVLYIESYIGTFSINDLHPVYNPINEQSNLKILKMTHNRIRKSDQL